MSCCPSNIIPFNNTAVSVVAYTPAMIATYGQKPKVQVIYYDNGEYYISNVQSSVKFAGNEITIDHGGPATGLIKIQ